MTEPSHPASPPAEAVLSLADNALRLIDAGRADEAAPLIAQAARLWTETFEAEAGQATGSMAKDALRRRSLAFYRAATEALPEDHADRAAAHTRLGTALLTQYQRSGRQEDLAAAVAFCHFAVLEVSENHPEKPVTLGNLGAALLAHYQRTGEAGSLDDAQQSFEWASSSTADGMDRLRFLVGFSDTLRERYEQTGDLEYLESAIRYLNETTAAGIADPGLRAQVAASLAHAWRLRFGQLGLTSDLDNGIDLLRRTSPPPGDPSAVSLLTNLGATLRLRYEHLNRTADIDEACEVLAQALSRTPAPSAERPAVAFEYCSALAARGTASDLEQAIELLDTVTVEALDDHPVRPMLYSLRGSAWLTRYGRTHSTQDLMVAVSSFEQAVADLTRGERSRAADLERSDALSGLSDALRSQSRLDDAEAAAREALASRADILSVFHGSTIEARNDLASILAEQGRVQEAETQLREALNALTRLRGNDNPAALALRGNLAIALARLGRASESWHELRTAVKGLTQVLGPSDPQTVGFRRLLDAVEADLRGALA